MFLKIKMLKSFYALETSKRTETKIKNLMYKLAI